MFKPLVSSKEDILFTMGKRKLPPPFAPGCNLPVSEEDVVLKENNIQNYKEFKELLS